MTSAQHQFDGLIGVVGEGLKEYLQEVVKQRNIMNYHGSNTAFLASQHTADILKLPEDVRRQLTTFPAVAHIPIPYSPAQQSTASSGATAGVGGLQQETPSPPSFSLAGTNPAPATVGEPRSSVAPTSPSATQRERAPTWLRDAALVIASLGAALGGSAAVQYVNNNPNPSPPAQTQPQDPASVGVTIR